jgi:hypothetical protein
MHPFVLIAIAAALAVAVFSIIGYLFPSLAFVVS